VRGIPGGDDLLRWIRRSRLRAQARAAAKAAAPVAPARAADLVLWLQVPDGDREHARAFVDLAPQIRLAAASACAPGERDWVYAPDALVHGLDAHALRNVLLCVAHQALDFVVVSHGMDEPPQLRIVAPRRAVVLSAAAKRSVDAVGQLPPGARGRIVRVLPPPAGAVLRDVTPGDLGLGPLEAEGAELRVAGAGSGMVASQRPRCALFPALAPPRETILVLPIMLAVGGAERNLIEVAKALRDRYAFVVVTTERLLASRGSLHHQILEHCEALFEIGELAPQSEFVALVESIAASYQPSLVWICNGSPWLLEHTAVLRRIFDAVPIVDQQVYDTDAGWIEHYGDAGIQSFDRFIAINQQIERVFRERIGIAPERIDLVHHAVDTARFHLAAADRCPRDVELQAFGLPRATPLVGMVGRLTEQKRPLDFLELARRAREAGAPAHFVLVGDGELGAACNAFVARYALDTVYRVPFCDDMSRLFPLLDGLVICSEYEGLPISMLEALAMGVPVLSTPVGDVPLVLEEFQVGRLVSRSGDAGALFTAFSAWWEELPQLRARARVAAPRIAERFSAEASAAAYEASWKRAQRERAAGRSATAGSAHA
jgi:glycosyltransferase involved in cell wall biosynthesis